MRRNRCLSGDKKGGCIVKILVGGFNGIAGTILAGDVRMMIGKSSDGNLSEGTSLKSEKIAGLEM
jgi:hypothetical protein